VNDPRTPFDAFTRALPGVSQLESLGERIGLRPPGPEAVLSGEPPEPIRPLYAALRVGVSLFLRFAERVTVEGLDRVPTRGPAILAPNHLNVHDSTVLMGVVPRVIRFVGKAEYMEQTATRMAFMLFGSIPVDRSSADSGHAALDAAAHVLDQGDLFGIFPEGTRSRDGLLHKGKTGVARLSIETDVPIIPVGLVGTEELQGYDDGVFVMRGGKQITVRFGEPLSPERYRVRTDQTLAPRQMTDDLMFEIAQLSEQRYVDEYSKRPDEE
jgi:1-acyl-sn-glycerol-3-phosphate acyltransferase